ncbi:hypothetical protein FIBSPDRAFT_1044599 [Athelia psychrophila]|uniref:Uncharacterized protein n=1 Tax=Athelia psychrophila TaxID=1759441 RepID=A0A166JFI1_9AGAM|nr:hypothetical protein FIBSPDRAFT_1044599 [Fibularhizoctonia sp. CBS 109695]
MGPRHNECELFPINVTSLKQRNGNAHTRVDHGHGQPSMVFLPAPARSDAAYTELDALDAEGAQVKQDQHACLHEGGQQNNARAVRPFPPIPISIPLVFLYPFPSLLPPTAPSPVLQPPSPSRTSRVATAGWHPTRYTSGCSSMGSEEGVAAQCAWRGGDTPVRYSMSCWSCALAGEAAPMSRPDTSHSSGCLLFRSGLPFRRPLSRVRVVVRRQGLGDVRGEAGGAKKSPSGVSRPSTPTMRRGAWQPVMIWNVRTSGAR